MSLSQANFAKLAGIKANAQSAYEKGIRIPRGDYLKSVGEGGADFFYIVSGKRQPLECDALNAAESTLIEHYRKIAELDRAAIGQLVFSLSQTASA